MFHTRVCEIFNIKVPIVLGGMVWAGGADLVAAVSEAGGLGLLGAGSMNADQVHKELATVKQKTKKTFGINMPLVHPEAGEMIAAALDCGANVIATSSGSPKTFTSMIHDRGARVLHVVSNVAFAKKCQDAGVDAIAAEGSEAGGHNGHDEITTMALIPQVAAAVDIPVVAAGGIADGSGLVAALALGAEGVQMGTRFIATKEAAVHPKYKEAVLNLADTGTCITGRTTVGPTRTIRNRLAEKIIQAEAQGMAPEKLFELIGGGRSALAALEGDRDEGSFYCGQIGGLIKELKGAGEVVDETVSQAREIINKLSGLGLAGPAL